MFTWMKNRFVKKTTKPVRRNSTELFLEVLEDRWCPSTTTWISHVGGGDWSNASNWSNGVPQAGDTAIFDPNHSYYNCVIDVNTPSVNVEITNGYNAQFIVNPGCTWNIDNFTDAQPGYEDSFNVQYQTSGSSGGSINISGTAIFANISISDSASGSSAMGKTIIASTGTAVFGSGYTSYTQPYNISIADEVDIYGVMYTGDYADTNEISTANFLGNEEVKSGGTKLVQGLQAGGIIESNTGLGNVIDVQSGGTLKFAPSPAGNSRNDCVVNMPIHNNGSFSVDGSSWRVSWQDTDGSAIVNTGSFTLGESKQAKLTIAGDFVQEKGSTYVESDSTFAPASDPRTFYWDGGNLSIQAGATLTLGGQNKFGSGQDLFFFC